MSLLSDLTATEIDSLRERRYLEAKHGKKILVDLKAIATAVDDIADGTSSFDTITEKTAGNGVSVDSVVLKDGGVAVVTGAAATPSYTFQGDTNTGMYRISADIIGFATDTAERLRISSTGIAVTGIVTVSSTTASTTKDTGALIVEGGAGIEKELYVGLSIHAGTYLTHGNGTVLLPGMGPESDPDSGMYVIGANNLGFAVAGAKVLDISTTGLGVVGSITSAGTVATNGIEFSGTYTNGHVIYIHPATTLATAKRAFRIADYGTEIEIAGGEGMIRTYAKTTTGTGATALQFHWGYNTVAAVGLIGSQMQYECQVAATGSDSLMGNDVIVGVGASKIMATTTGDMTKGLIGGRFKVYSDATSTTNGSVACLWLDSQMSSAVAETECSIRATTGGTQPDAFILLSTTSSGWDQFLYLDATMAAAEPFVATGCSVTVATVPYLKVLVNATQYGIPLIAI